LSSTALSELASVTGSPAAAGFGTVMAPDLDCCDHLTARTLSRPLSDTDGGSCSRIWPVRLSEVVEASSRISPDAAASGATLLYRRAF
jgi:hypothetical protein